MPSLEKKARDKLARAMRKAQISGKWIVNKHGKRVFIPNKLINDIERAKAREIQRQHLLTTKQYQALRDTANVHLGNKLLKPDAGFYNPTGTRTMASVKAGKATLEPYHVKAPKKQKGAGYYKRNPLD